MSCPDCDLDLQRLLDGDEAVSPAPEVSAHRADCPVCRERQAAALLLFEGLRRLSQPMSAPGLNKRIAAAVLADRQQRLTWRRRYALIATAAAFLLVPFLGIFWLANPGTAPIPRGLVKPVTPPNPIAESKPAPPKTAPLRPQLDESRAGLTALVDRLARSNQPGRLVQSVSLTLEMGSGERLTGMDTLSQPLGNATNGAQHAAQGFAFGSQVINGTTRRALSYFSRNLPPLSAPPKHPL